MASSVRGTAPLRDGWATGLFAGALVLASLALAASSGRTLGLWDEIYYVQWIDAPDAYGALVQPFGLFLHPFYVLAGRSLVATRLAGIALLVGTGMAMGRGIERYVRAAAPGARVAHLPLAGGFAALLYYVIWILTPSYNLLANAGAALVLAGAFGWAARDRGVPGGGWQASLCCGLGGGLMFLGKPTSAVLAGGLIAVQLALAGRRDWRGALVRAAIAGAAAAALVATAIRAAMPFGQFVARVGAGVQALGADYSTAGLVREAARSLLHAPKYTLASAAVLFAGIAVQFLRPSRGRARAMVVLVAAALALLAMNVLQLLLLLRVGIFHGVDPWTNVAGTPVVGILLVSLALGIVRSGAIARDAKLALPFLALAATPYLIAFGTANDLMRQAGMSLFPVLVAGVLAARLCFPTWLARAAELGWVAIAGVLLGWSALRPYNQPAPVLAATRPTALPFTASRLRLDPATASYARSLAALARSAGITPATPVLDLSGIAPGTVALLGARAPFFPWIIPFSKRPDMLAGAAWRSLTPRDQGRTWIVGPVDPRFLKDPAITGLVASGRYRRVAVLRYAPGAGQPPVTFWAPVTR